MTAAATEPGAPGPARETAAQRIARLRALSARQRDDLAARWGRVSPLLERVDDTVERVRRIREHPLALGLVALSAVGLATGGRNRRMFGLMRFGWRIGLRAATVASLWRALRGAMPAAPPRRGDDPGPGSQPGPQA